MTVQRLITPLQSVSPTSPSSSSTSSGHNTEYTYDTDSDTEQKDQSDMYDVHQQSYDSILPHYTHQWLDVYNTRKKKWYEAQIVDMNFVRQLMCVHYKGLDSTQYDEWMPTDEFGENRFIQPLNTMTQPKVRSGQHQHNTAQYKVHDQVDILDEYDRWTNGTVTDIDTSYYQYCVSYVDAKHRVEHNEWLNYNSYRLSPYNTQQKHNSGSIVNVQHYNHTQSPPRRHTPPAQHSPSQAHAAGYTTTDETELKFRRALNQRLGFDIIEMSPDGNCLFRSVSHQVYGTPDHHQIVRQSCMQYIESEQLFFKNYISEPFDTYIARMKQGGEWGDHVEIQAMSEMYDRPIEIYAYSTTPMKTFNANASAVQAAYYNTQPQQQKMIRLSYHFASHYNSVVDQHQPHIARDLPGELEQRAIHRSQLGSAVGLQRASAQSDVEATERIQMQQILQNSRQQFNLVNQTEYDRAVQDSLAVLNGEGDSALEAARTESLREFETQQQVNQAMQLSAQQSSSSSAAVTDSASDLHASSSNLEEQNIARALAESMKQAGETHKPAAVSIDSSVALNEPVQRCMELGFSLEDCVAAYTMFNEPNTSIDTVTQNMSAYLFAAM